jgi:hypothetical protein
MTDDERAAALREIASEAQRLRIKATNVRADMLAYLLENVLHEARAELAKTGASLEPEPPQGGNVVRLR